MQNQVAAIVLAAGKGARMKSTTTNKVALTLAERPIIAYTIDNLQQAGISTIITVVGFAQDSVREALGDRGIFVTQRWQKGTGDAVKVGLSAVPGDVTDVVSVYGDDSAFYPPEVIRQLIATHQAKNADITLLTVKKNNPAGLGRIIRDKTGSITAIVEEKNAVPTQKLITEINTGLYCFKRTFLDTYIHQIQKNPVSGEYYLTDLIEIAKSAGAKVEAVLCDDNSVWQGINDPSELDSARLRMAKHTK
ncbi:hypothetical protein A3B57_04005 [Microgenomates group bacterium RIFCSPLOWO2_01_FULL_47_10]|nr:MAG: hypothetical protein A3B57_04005 [Microgenomates group bacterium RIFCSPLOWO2_01_FULL_47_10]